MSADFKNLGYSLAQGNVSIWYGATSATQIEGAQRTQEKNNAGASQARRD